MYFIAMEIKAHYAGMMIAVALDVWQAFDCMTTQQLSRALLKIAAHADPRTLRKHPRAPKPPVKKGYVAAALAKQHVATARILRDGWVS